MFVEAAGNEDGDGEESQLEDFLPLCRNGQLPGDIGQDPVH